MNIKDLKTYIRGAVEFHDNEWHPNKQQWDKIVDIIIKLNSEPSIPPNKHITQGV